MEAGKFSVVNVNSFKFEGSRGLTKATCMNFQDFYIWIVHVHFITFP